MASLEKIKEEAAAERSLLRAERSKVVARIGELQDLDELTAAEGKQLKDLKAYRDELTEAMLDLSLVTLGQIESLDRITESLACNGPAYLLECPVRLVNLAHCSFEVSPRARFGIPRRRKFNIGHQSLGHGKGGMMFDCFAQPVLSAR